MDDRFIELLTKKLSGEITPDEYIELQAFLNKDAAYHTQYNIFKLYWETKDADYHDDAASFQKVRAKIARLEDSGQTSATEAAQPDLPAIKASFFTFWRSIAAMLMLLSCCACLFYLKYKGTAHNLSITYYQKTTQRRTKSIIVLSDGTKITLNSESTLKYPIAFTGKTREVYLTGEAFFDVHKDHQHPFIIHTGKMNVRVLGTEFNVRSYPNETLTETSLIRGSIEVTLSDRPSDHIILKPKEKLIVKNNHISAETNTLKSSEPVAEANTGTQYTLTSLTHINKDTAAVETSWLDNKLVANNEEFKDLAHNMERWYGMDIHFANSNLEKLRFTAFFEKENITEALDALRRVEKFHYKIDKSNVYIY